MKIRTLIVDDEALARERLRKLLEAEADIEFAGECGDGRAAVTAIRKESPDLVFLDVQMPELDGFGVLAEISNGPMPVVVFVTAHDKFALKAFDVHAVDYLLKPFDRVRFQKALQRACDQVQRRRAGELNQQLSALLAEFKPVPKSVDRLAIKTGKRIVLVNYNEIDWIEAADNYVDVHIGKESHLLRETMNALAERLPAAQFVRIGRSTIVNIAKIKELQPLFHGEYSVILHDGTSLILSRNYREKLSQLGLE